MKTKIIFLAAILLAATFSVNAQSTSQNNYIEVTGTSEQKVSPDLFFLKIVIDEQDSKGRTTLEQQQAAMIKALKGLGIDTDKQLRRLSLTSSFYRRKSSLASGTFELKLSKENDVTAVWKALDALGLSEVAFTRAEYGAIDSLRGEVRCQAARDAKSQAESLAGAIGQSIGKCIYMHGGYSGNAVLYAQPRLTKALMADFANGTETVEENVEFGDITVSATVTARFELQ